MNGFGPTGSAGAVDGSCPRVGRSRPRFVGQPAQQRVVGVAQPGHEPGGQGVRAQVPVHPEHAARVVDDVVEQHLRGLGDPEDLLPNQSVAAGPSPVSPRPLVNTTGCAGRAARCAGRAARRCPR